MTLVQRASQTQPRVVEPNPRPSFTGFPETTLLESGKIPITEIAELALRGYPTIRWIHEKPRFHSTNH